jgi:hypothetical protein
MAVKGLFKICNPMAVLVRSNLTFFTVNYLVEHLLILVEANTATESGIID